MFCVLGDCWKQECHHCFPVKHCMYNHDVCSKDGTCYDTDLKKYSIIVTGCAGFIGYHLCKKLLSRGFKVVGIDNVNDYYSTTVKEKNINALREFINFRFLREDVIDTSAIEHINPDVVVHLASMAGVRYSIENPQTYIDNNISGFINILEQCKKIKVKRIVYASSSSVYGLNVKVPFSEDDPINNCNSPYACSKYAMETFAGTYQQLYNIETVGLRFFTVYGPNGRPDMAPYKFLKSIKNDKLIEKYGSGTSSRDYTYVDDIVDGIVGAMFSNTINKRVYNLGNSDPVSLNAFIKLCENICRKDAIVKMNPMPLGDVPHTFADITHAKRDLGYDPKTTLYEGMSQMYNWMVEEGL